MGYIRTCCCGRSLKTGTLIIGSLSFIFSTLLLIGVIFTIHQKQIGNDKYFKEENHESISSSGGTITYKKQGWSISWDFTSMPMGFLGLFAAVLTASVITSLLLIIGTVKGYMWLILPWIADASLFPIGMVMYVIYSLGSSENLTLATVASSVLGLLSLIALPTYLIMVVASHFLELRKENKLAGNIGKIYSNPNCVSSQSELIINEEEGN